MELRKELADELGEDVIPERVPEDDAIAAVERAVAAVRELAPSRENSLAVTSLQQALMWIGVDVALKYTEADPDEGAAVAAKALAAVERDALEAKERLEAELAEEVEEEPEEPQERVLDEDAIRKAAAAARNVTDVD